MFIKVRGRWLYPEPGQHLELEERKAVQGWINSSQFQFLGNLDFIRSDAALTDASVQQWSPCPSSVGTQMPASVKEGNLFSLIRELFKCTDIAFI